MFNRVYSKYKRLPIEAKAAFWFTFCTMFQKGILFITSPIFIHIMSSDQYGQYCIYTSWMNILSMVMTLNLQAAVFNNAMHKYKNDRDKYISSMQGLSLALLLGFFIFFICFKNIICKDIFSMEPKVVFLIFIYTLFLPGYNFWICRNRFEYKYNAMVIVTILVSALSLFSSIILVSLVKDEYKAYSALIAYVFIHSIVGAVLMYKNILKGRKLYIGKYWSYAVKFNIPLIPHYLSSIVLGQADRIMIGRYCGNSDAGLYSFVYNIPLALNVFILSINQAITPWQYKKIDEKNFKSIVNVWLSILVFLGLIMLFIIAFAPDIILILGTKEYLAAKWIVPTVVLGVYFTALYNMFGVYEFYFEATKFVMTASVMGAVLNIMLNAIFIPRYGYMAAAYTTLFCYIIFAFAHMIFSHILVKKNFNITFVLGEKKVLLILAGMSILSLFMLFTYFNNILRYSSAVILFIVIIVISKNISKNIAEVNR